MISKGMQEEINAVLWLILAAVIVGLQGWGIVSVAVTVMGIINIGCACYFHYQEHFSKEEGV